MSRKFSFLASHFITKQLPQSLVVIDNNKKMLPFWIFLIMVSALHK